MKVLFYIGYPLKMAGSQRQISELILGMEGVIEREVIVNSKGEVSKFFEDQNVKVNVLNIGSPLNNYGKKLLKPSFSTALKALISWLRYFVTFASFLNKSKADIVHFNDLRCLTFGFFSCFIARKKVVCHIQGEFNFSSKKILFFYRIIDLFVDQYILNGNFNIDGICKNKNKVTVIHTGILDPSSIPHESQVQKNDKVKIGYFASIVPFKGQHLFLNAISKLDKITQDQTEVYFVGGIQKEYQWYYDYCQTEIAKFGLKNIVFTDWTNNPFGYMKDMDIVALTSYRVAKLEIDGEIKSYEGNEGFPTVHIEGMTFSKPLIGTNIAAVSDLVLNEINGFLIEEGDLKSLTRSLDRLINDKSLRIALGTKGREIFLSKFQRHIFVSNVIDLYRNKLS